MRNIYNIYQTTLTHIYLFFSVLLIIFLNSSTVFDQAFSLGNNSFWPSLIKLSLGNNSFWSSLIKLSSESLMINLNPREKVEYELEKKLSNLGTIGERKTRRKKWTKPENYGLFSTTRIPKQSLIGTFEPLSTFDFTEESKKQLEKKTIDYQENDNLMWAKLIIQKLKDDFESEEKQQLFVNCLNKLSPRDKEPCKEPSGSLDLPKDEMERSEKKKMKDGDAEEEIDKIDESTELILLKLGTNCFAASSASDNNKDDNVGNDEVVKLYYTPSFINHSCIPNCSFDAGTGMLYSLKDIGAHEELTICYSTDVNLLFRCWGFDCSCPLHRF